MEPMDKSVILARYESEISSYPPELQTAGAVLYALVRTVSQHNNSSSSKSTSDDANNPDALQCHHFIDGLKMNKLQVLGPDATFLSLVDQAKHFVSASTDAIVIECNDGMGMRAAKAADFGNESAGIISTNRYTMFF